MTAGTDIAAARALHAGVPAPTVAAVRRALAAQFRAAGIGTPDVDARILVGHALRLDHAALAAAAARRLNAADLAAIAALSERRLKREPVARIVGTKEFWTLELRIGPDTLVPRPESETIVEAALDAIGAAGPRTRPLRVADLGTGSGALLLTLLSELPNAVGIGTDISVGALVVARDNARRLGLTRAHFVACDMAAALGGRFDVIVANPPYIPTATIGALAPEVRDYDPRAALDGGVDGLDGYRAIAAAAPALLTPDGAVVVELGTGVADAVAALFSAAGLAPAAARPDLSGKPRALLAKIPRERP
jgi:release factor glutamine methyltransferase